MRRDCSSEGFRFIFREILLKIAREMNFKSFISTLTQTLNWHKDRCETFNCMVMGLIDQGNVQHHALATPLKTQGTLKSKLERIRWFFAKQIIDCDAFALQMVTNPNSGLGTSVYKV